MATNGKLLIKSGGVAIMFLVNITINSVKFYDECVSNNLKFSGELDEKVQPILKLMRREEVIEKVLKK